MKNEITRNSPHNLLSKFGVSFSLVWITKKTEALLYFFKLAPGFVTPKQFVSNGQFKHIPNNKLHKLDMTPILLSNLSIVM